MIVTTSKVNAKRKKNKYPSIPIRGQENRNFMQTMVFTDVFYVSYILTVFSVVVLNPRSDIRQ